MHNKQKIQQMKYRGLIFDYGGTLDTGGCHWGKHIWHAYQESSVPVSEQQFREAYVHAERTLGRNPIIKPDFTFRDTLAKKLELQLQYLDAIASESGSASSGTSLSLLLGMKSSLLDRLYAATQHHTAHSREILMQLREQGLSMVLVSNFYGNIHTVLREFMLDGLFSHVVESAVVGVRKPDPRIFKLGVEALGLNASEVVVVGDSIDKDIIPARQAGCQTVWISGEQWTDDPVDTSQADGIISDLAELQGLVSSVGSISP